MRAVRPGCIAGWLPCTNSTVTPTACATRRTSSRASAMLAATVGCPGWGGVPLPVSSTARWRGCGGMPACSAASSVAEGRRSPEGRVAEPYSLSAAGKKTRPCSKSEISVSPRARFRRAAAMSPGSNERRNSPVVWSSGFARRMDATPPLCARIGVSKVVTACAATPNTAFSASVANGNVSTSTHPPPPTPPPRPPRTPKSGARMRGAPEHGVLCLGGKRKREHFDRPRRGQCVGSLPTQSLSASETTTRWRDRQHRRNTVVAGEPSNLLRKLSAPGQIRPPRRRCDTEPTRGLGHGCTNLAERAHNLTGRIVSASPVCDVVSGQINDPCDTRRTPGTSNGVVPAASGAHHLSTARPSHNGPGFGNPTRVLHHQVCHPRGCRFRNLRVYPAFKAAGCLARHPVPPRGARDRNGVEVRRLDKHVARAISQLGVGTAHDTGEPNRTPVVRDDQILRVERALFLVERCERFARARASHGDAAAQRIEVIAVNRLPDLKHDVVRDVNKQRAGPDARERESRHHPRRCRATRVDTAHDTGGKHGCPGATTNRIIIGERDREETGNTRRTVGDGISGTGLPNTPTTRPRNIGHRHRITKSRPGCVRVLARTPADREGVAAIGGDVDLHGCVIQAQQWQRAAAHRGILQPQCHKPDNTGVVIAKTELPG